MLNPSAKRRGTEWCKSRQLCRFRKWYTVSVLEAEPANLDGMITIPTADAKLYIPMGQLVDVEKEIARITKELEGQKKFLASLEGKLSNEKFISRAPEAVVAAEREKAQKARDLIAQLEQSLDAMKKL